MGGYRRYGSFELDRGRLVVFRTELLASDLRYHIAEWLPVCFGVKL